MKPWGKKNSSGAQQEPPAQSMDERSALTDEDSSYGPVPPPPPTDSPEGIVMAHQQSYEATSAAAGVAVGEDIENHLSIESMGYVDEEEEEDNYEYENLRSAKDDPPQDTSANTEDESYDAEENQVLIEDNDEDDITVEIPPTSVVQRMLAREQSYDDVGNDFDGKETQQGKFFKLGAIAACLLASVAIALGASYASGAFGSSNNASASTTQQEDTLDRGISTEADVVAGVDVVSNETVENTSQRAGDMLVMLSENSLAPDFLSIPESGEAKAMNWLLADDPLQLDPTDETNSAKLLQRYALASLYLKSTEKWNDETGWLGVGAGSDDDECTWVGVTCTNGVVTALDLSSNNLTRGLPVDLALLTEMRILILGQNQLDGKLPNTLSTMSSLEVLDVEDNDLKQNLSDFDWSGLTNLRVLNIGQNKFFGTLDNFARTLPADQLVSLRVNDNDFTGGVSSSFQNFHMLSTLDVEENVLTGTFPNVFGDMGGLKVLRAGKNDWDVGEFPFYFYVDMGGLEEVDLEDCGFTGAIEGAISGMTNIRELHLDDNFIERLPNKLFTAVQSLEILTAENNQITGTLPDPSGLTNLKELRLGMNEYTGTIPDTFELMTALSVYSVDRNLLTGPFPPSATQAPTIEEFDISRNTLSGPIPAAIGAMFSLRILDLSLNSSMDVEGASFSGQIPASLNSCRNLEELYLRGNLFTGALPDLGNLTKLREIDLRYNFLEGGIPDSIANWSASIERATFSNNDFTGAVPDGICAGDIEFLAADCALDCSCCTECVERSR